MLTASISDKQINAIANKLNILALKKKKALDDELALGSLLIESTAKELAPVDSGLLRSSIHAVKDSYLRYKVAVNVNYAVFVEQGTSKMNAQPFLFPALQMHKATILANCKLAIKK